MLQADGLPRALANAWPSTANVDRPAIGVTRGRFVPIDMTSIITDLFPVRSCYWYLQLQGELPLFHDWGFEAHLLFYQHRMMAAGSWSFLWCPSSLGTISLSFTKSTSLIKAVCFKTGLLYPSSCHVFGNYALQPSEMVVCLLNICVMQQINNFLLLISIIPQFPWLVRLVACYLVIVVNMEHVPCYYSNMCWEVIWQYPSTQRYCCLCYAN